jgi:hypothetical protein
MDQGLVVLGARDGADPQNLGVASAEDHPIASTCPNQSSGAVSPRHLRPAFRQISADAGLPI